MKKVNLFVHLDANPRKDLNAGAIAAGFAFIFVLTHHVHRLKKLGGNV